MTVPTRTAETLLDMMLLRPSRFFRLLAATALAVLLTLLFVLGQKPPSIGLLIPPFDKVVHFGFYATVGVLVWVTSGARSPWLVPAAVGVIGFLDEFAQQFNPGRDVSFWDWTADMVGAVVALTALVLIRRWRGRLRPAAA